ncbi:MAG: hypothetical protein V4595_11530 [Pseudomonadota bacterium]|jgi:hypothetical protein
MTHKTNRQIFALPILLGVSTCAGLGAGLVGDGVWDVGAGLLLALPLVVTGRYWVRPAEPVLRRQQLQPAPIRQ